MPEDSEHRLVVLTVQDGIARVSLNRPEKRNALCEAMVAQIIAVGETCKADRSIRAVILTGEGHSFCAGLDKEIFLAMTRIGASAVGRLADRTHGISNRFQRMVMIWRELDVPVIAALDGAVLGGGFQLALGADIRYATAQARFSIMEVRWGIVPDCGGTALMQRYASDGIVRELCFTGADFSAAEAQSYGFLNAIVTDPRSHATETARKIAGLNPDAVRAIKRLLNGAGDRGTAEQLLAESEEQDLILGSRNQVEAVNSNLEGRAPRFVG